MPALLLLLLLLAAACVPASSPPPPAGGGDDAERWVERTLASLTPREKVGQLLMPGTGGNYVALDSREFAELAAWVEEVGIGGISLSIGQPHAYAAKLNALQARARVPLLVSSNMESGPGQRLAGSYSIPHLLPQGGGTVFPPVMALGATGSDSLAYAQGRITGVEARAVGVHLTFSPTLDVNSNPANPIINTRSFGSDPRRVAELGVAFLRGARDAGLLTTAKHFPGHGDTDVDSHIDLPVIAADREQLDRVELAPFRAAVAAGVDAVMTAHIAVRGVEGPDAPPATLSPYFLTRVLREEMDFEGLIVTDAMEMGAITRRYGDVEALLLALEAGADVLLKPLDVRRALDGIVAAVEDGRISGARLDASVRRVLRAKARAGLHRGALVELDSVDARVGGRAHTAVADTVARRALTLLRDRDRLVPLRGEPARVLAVTYAAPRDLVAGRGFDRALAGGGHAVTSARTEARTTPAEWAALGARAESADLIVLSIYVSPLEGAGSVAVGGGVEGFAAELLARDRPVLVISFGSPYVVDAFRDAPAHLLAWSGEEPSQRAAALALLGRAALGARLPVPIPPLYPLGHGLDRPAVR